MALKVKELPDRFPVGTKFVIEGRPGARPSRSIELPDGTTYRLPPRKPQSVRRNRHLRTRAT
jgi:hypothetical protein